MTDAEEENTRLPDKIALCLSGGGYRAAGFHLGTLDYLDHLGLRDRVTMLSTVSGGTFIGTSYVLALIDKKPFATYLAIPTPISGIHDTLKEFSPCWHRTARPPR